MDDRDAHDASIRRRLELPRRQPGEDGQEGDGGWAEGLLPGIASPPETAGEAFPPDRGAPIPTEEPDSRTTGLRHGSGAEVVDRDEPRPPFRTPEEMLAEEDWPDLPGGGEIWDSAAASGEDSAIEDERAD